MCGKNRILSNSTNFNLRSCNSEVRNSGLALALTFKSTNQKPVLELPNASAENF
jgi:hypothetical protein